MDKKEILEYWNKDDVESMYDKFLLNAEIDLIYKNLKSDSVILDAGCGEGEGTLKYSELEGVQVTGADFSDTRLKKAREHTENRTNIILKKIDFLSEFQFENKFDTIICQRFLINLLTWENQKEVILKLIKCLNNKGKLILLEGSQQGVDELNDLRKLFDLPPINVKWHNLFFNDDILEDLLTQNNFTLRSKSGLGTYYFLTRGLRPTLDKELNWDSPFNEKAVSPDMTKMLGYESKFSRTRLWVFEKN